MTAPLDWSLVAGALRDCAGDLDHASPLIRSQADQVSATIRDLFGAGRLDLHDERTLLAAVSATTLLTAQVASLEQLGLVCPASAFAVGAVLRGDLAMFADYAPAAVLRGGS